MTACANKNEGKALSGKKAVSATLAGVLAVGMVPAAALANPAEEGAEDADIDLLLVGQNAFARATVVSVIDNNGNTVKPKEGALTLDFTGGPNPITSVTFKTADGKEIVATDGDEFDFSYFKEKSVGSYVEADYNEIQATGSYQVKVEYIGENVAWKDQANVVNFTIDVPEAVVDSAVEIRTAQDVTSSDIMFSGVNAGSAFDTADAGRLAYVVDGEIKPVTDVKIFEADDTSKQLNNGDLLYAGDYVAVLDGVAVKFTVKPFDISEAAIVANAVAVSPTNTIPAVDVAGTAYDWMLTNYADVKFDSSKNEVAQVANGAYGEYTLTVAPKETSDKNLEKSVIGTKDVKVKYVKDVADIKYGSVDLKDWSQTYTVGGTSVFSKDAVKFLDDASKAIDSKFCSVKVLNAAGDEVTEWSAAGTYTVVAEVNDPDFTYGGTATSTFKVTYGNINANADIAVYYDGKLATSVTKTYDGEDAIDSITVEVTKGDKVLVEGTDYTLVYKNTDTNKEVTEIVDAGKYELTVKPINFTYTGKNTLPIIVNAIEPTALRVADQISVNSVYGLPYTGSAITPVIEYTTTANPVESDWKVLPADVYTVAYGYSKDLPNASTEADELTYKKADSMVEAGAYELSVRINASCPNYDLTGVETAYVNVIDAKRFLDVPADAWFAPYVDKAATLKYIAGYSNGRFFGPNDSITRGDVCVVLARMANVKLWIDENAGSETKYFETPFADVDGNLYYAEAIAWAAKVGIAKGYGDGTNFEPNSTISRQEFATMLARYAALAGDDTAADVAGELAKYVDGSAVADWAQGAIAWASEEGIMQGYGDTGVLAPELNVSRAEVAKMAVVYQPETPEGVVIDPDANN